MTHRNDFMQPEMWSTFVDLLRARAACHPERSCFTFLADGETCTEHLSYGALDDRARAIAAWLLQQGAFGKRVLVMHPCGLEYVAAFFGCLYAGCVAVPVPGPRRRRSVDRIGAIVADSQPAIALGLASQLDEFQRWAGEAPVLGRVKLQASDVLGNEWAPRYRQPDIEPDTLAFLQYTSGSTGSPQGVMVCHRNLLANQQLIQQAFGNSEHDVGLSWLPLYHDMGLVGMVIQTLYVGAHCVLMSPNAFLQRPIRWLQGISRYRVTTSGGPNFAFELCLREILPKDREGLDLSSWEVAFNGAEPISAETIERFTQAFAPHGFRHETWHPCYGLAEGTLLVTGGAKHDPPVFHSVDTRSLAQHTVVPMTEVNGRGQRFVGCGLSLNDGKVRIVDAQTRRICPAGQIGEIWVSSPSVALGYWNRPEVTEQIFRAKLADGEGPFLRTGDLGFFHGEQLFVTGRCKDLIIVHGCNHYPHDIERSVARSHAAFADLGGAAFTCSRDGQDRLVVVHEVGRTWIRDLPLEALGEAARTAVSERHELQLHELVLVKPAGVPRTSSGKIRRRVCYDAYRTGTLPVVGCWQQNVNHPLGFLPGGERACSAGLHSREAIERWLVECLATRLKLESKDIDVERRFSSYGFDSIEAVCLTTALQEQLGRPLDPLVAFDHPSIRCLAVHLAETLSADTRAVHP